MNETIFNILETVAETSSKNEKIAILSQHKDNVLLRDVFRLAYDTTLNFYIKKIPEYKPNETQSLSWALESLNDLVSRKFTGNAAVDHLSTVLSSLSKQDASIVERIVKRDLRVGCSASTANKVWKNLIPDFPYMRCSLLKDVKLDTWDWKRGVYSQLKADSLYANLDVVDDIVTLTSRNGKEFPIEKFSAIKTEALGIGFSNFRLHGELQVSRNGQILPRQIGNGILNHVESGGDFDEGDIPVYSVWDIIPTEIAVPKGKYLVSYEERLGHLKTLFSDMTHIHIIETRIVHSIEEAYAHYFEKIALGLEGTIIKNPHGTWADNTSKHQAKLKLEVEVELKVVGFIAGNGKNENTFGALLCESSDALLQCGVGSGLTDKERDRLFNNSDTIGSIVTVKFNNIMPPTKSNQKYSLFLPIYVETRNDKTEADSLQRIKDQFESALRT